jgi:FMN phosphatase YigB (HAD superfamily)
MIHIFDLDDTLLLSNSYYNYSDININNLLNVLLHKLEKKYIFTNGTFGHAHRALSYMRTPLFRYIFARDNLYDNQKMKPYLDPYIFIMNTILSDQDNHNESIIFYDDMLCNLKTAKNINWITVWINDSFDPIPEYVDYKFDTIIDALIYFR